MRFIAFLLFSVCAFAEDSNKVISSVHRQAIDAMAGSKDSDVTDMLEESLVKDYMSRFPTIPQEPGLPGFPDPVSAEEKNARTLKDYYLKVSDIYYRAAKDATTESQIAHEKYLMAKRSDTFNGFGKESRKLGIPSTKIQKEKAYLSNLMPKASQSRKSVPSSIHKASMNHYYTHYKQLRLRSEEYTLRGNFYSKMADFFTPKG